MKILTKFHGEIEINEPDIFTFESGIPGFLDEKKFTLLSLDETPFFVLAIDDNKRSRLHYSSIRLMCFQHMNLIFLKTYSTNYIFNLKKMSLYLLF